MQNQIAECEAVTGGTVMDKMSLALHDLCQPLTTLQCRLEIAGLMGTDEAYRDAVNLGLVECARLINAVGSMREVVRVGRRQVGEAEEAGAAR
jgi:signal transduction histidine kinase